MLRGNTAVCGNGFRIGFSIFVSTESTIHSFGHLLEENETSTPFIFPNSHKILFVDCGLNHLIFLSNDNTVFTLGDNTYGQLGIGEAKDKLPYSFEPQKIDLPPIKQVCSGYRFNICVSDDGNVYFFGELKHTFDNSPQQIESLKDIDFVACGCDYAIYKSINNNIFIHGSNGSGQLGNGNTFYQNIPNICYGWPNNIVDIKCGQRHTLVLTSNQEVYSCGNNVNGQLGFNTAQSAYVTVLTKIHYLSEIIRIECGNDRSVCIDVYDNLYVFGNNFYGQLGFGDTMMRSTPVKHPLLSNIIDVSSRGNHVFVKTSNNEIFAFGDNEFSQLGIETKDKYQLTPIQVLQGKEDFWCSNINKPSKAKSARSISNRVKGDDSPPNKKQKI